MPAFGDHHSLMRFGEIVDQFIRFGMADHSPDRDFDFQIFAGLAGLVTTQPVLAARGSKDVVITKFKKGGFLRLGNEVDIAAIAAITAARSAARYEFFATEGNATVTAISGFDGDLRFVDEQLLCRDGLNTDETSGATFVLVLHDSGYLREQSVVPADADVDARLELRTALPDEDGSARYQLSAEPLDAEPLRVTVATVT